MRTDNHTSPYNFFPKNLRGQFYLIATIVIIAVIIGFVTISNYAQKQDSIKIYNLGEELNIEGENVLDYGIYNGLDKTETANLLKEFVETYSEYLGGDIEIYLLVGDDESLIVIGQEEGLEEDFEIDFDLTGAATQNLKRFATKEFKPENSLEAGNKIKVKIKRKSYYEGHEEDEEGLKEGEDFDYEEYEYEFELKEGENFYFIISQKVGEETYVTTN